MTPPDQLFRTIVSEDWKRNLAAARSTKNSVASQIREGVARTMAEREKAKGNSVAADQSSINPSDKPAFFKSDRIARMRGENPGTQDRTQQFALVAARLRRAGVRVDVYADYWLRMSLKQEIQRYLVPLRQALKTCGDELRPQVQQRIEELTKNLAVLNHVSGIAHTPKHIAVGMEYEQTGSLKDLVVLLHEGGHALLRGNELLRERALRAVTAAVDEFQTECRHLNRRTAVRAKDMTDPEELLVHTIAQRTALAGVPNAPSFARGVVQWAKDVYFRCRMAFQAARGEEIQPQLALKWFENQMARLVEGRLHGGDVSHGEPNHQAAQLTGAVERLRERYAVAPKAEQAQLLRASDESVQAYGGRPLTAVSLQVAARSLVKGETSRVAFYPKALKHFEAIARMPQSQSRRTGRGHER